MEMMGYDIAKREGLCFNQGRRAPPQSCVSKGKNLDYYNKTKHSLEYVSFEPDINAIHENSSDKCNTQKFLRKHEPIVIINI